MRKSGLKIKAEDLEKDSAPTVFGCGKRGHLDQLFVRTYRVKSHLREQESGQLKLKSFVLFVKPSFVTAVLICIIVNHESRYYIKLS